MNRFTGRAWVAVAGVAIVLTMVHVADAQRGEGGRGGRGGGRGFGGRGGFGLSLVDLARADEVQAALKLSDEQKDKVTEIGDQFRDERRELFRQGGDPREMQEEMQKLNAEATEKLTKALDDTQNKRLLGILAQVDAGVALGNPTIAKELGITEDQKKALDEVRDSNREAMGTAMREMREQDLSRAEMTKQTDELRADAGKKLLAALTSDQQSQFEALKGEPVKIDMSQFRMGGRGGRGGGGGGGGGGRGDGGGNRGGDGGGGAAESDRGA